MKTHRDHSQFLVDGGQEFIQSILPGAGAATALCLVLASLIFVV